MSHAMRFSTAVLLLGMVGCGGTEEAPTEMEQSALLPNVNAIDVGRTTRYQRVVCKLSCNVRTGCRTDCTDDVASVTLHASEADALRSPEPTLFREHHGGPDWRYRGCGPQAVMNMASYFGVNLSIHQAWSMTSTIEVPKLSEALGRIMSTPQAVRDGLAYVLDHPDYKFHTVVRNGITLADIRRELLRGYPVAALVNTGTHYQVITGYRSPDQYFVIDYPNAGQWRSGADLCLTFEGEGGVVNWVGYEGYKNNTIITTSFTDVGGSRPTGPSQCDEPIGPCPGGQSINPATCSCECNELSRTQCESNPDNIWDNFECTCKANR